jgi:hypothetical protein
VIQWIVGYISGNSLRAKAQASYNQWYRVAELADQIRSDPARAVEYAASINGMADAVRSEIVAYSRERLDFIPVFEQASQPLPGVAKPNGVWSKIRLGFSAK